MQRCCPSVAIENHPAAVSTHHIHAQPLYKLAEHHNDNSTDYLNLVYVQQWWVYLLLVLNRSHHPHRSATALPQQSLSHLPGWLTFYLINFSNIHLLRISVLIHCFNAIHHNCALRTIFVRSRNDSLSIKIISIQTLPYATTAAISISLKQPQS